MGALRARGGVPRLRVRARSTTSARTSHAYFGDVLGAIDNLVDRSPVGRLRIDGGVLRNVIHCNWKMYLENINDTVHPLSTHESATRAASALWQRPAGRCAQADGDGADPAVRRRPRLLRPHGRPRATPTGTACSAPTSASTRATRQVPEYEAAMRAAHGDERAAEILQRSPQNSLCFPSLSVKGSPQAIRVIRPLAADRTLVEAWSFRVEGAPDLLFERSMTYNRLVFSPMSVVAHDDVHLFESIQQGLRAGGNEWVSLHRDFDRGRARRRRARRQRHQRAADAQPVPRLGDVHDAGHGRLMSTARRLRRPRSASARRAAATTSGSRCSPTTAATGCRCKAPRSQRARRTTRWPTRTGCC